MPIFSKLNGCFLTISELFVWILGMLLKLLVLLSTSMFIKLNGSLSLLTVTKLLNIDFKSFVFYVVKNYDTNFIKFFIGYIEELNILDT